MKKALSIFLIVVGTSLFTGCDIDTGENFHFVSLKVVEASIPEHFLLNQSHNIEVSFVRPDDCTFFEGFDVFSDTGGLRTIVPIGSVLTNQDCSSQEENLTGILTLTAIEEEQYTLRFYAGEDADGNAEYIEYVVPVVDN